MTKYFYLLALQLVCDFGVLKHATNFNFPYFCLGCVTSGGIPETISNRSDKAILSGYDTLLFGKAEVPVNQTNNFTFDVTEKAIFKVENIMEDTDIKYDELNFLYQNIESIDFTIGTRENKTYRLSVRTFSLKERKFRNLKFTINLQQSIVHKSSKI